MFVLNERGRQSAPRQAHDKRVAETKQLIVPPAIHVHERKRRKVRVLLVQQLANQRFVDVNVCVGFACHRAWWI